MDELTEGMTMMCQMYRHEAVSKESDTWPLGDHRLMCGDSTNPGYVGCLVDNQPVYMVWTDTPCNVDYEGKTKEALKIDNDRPGAAHVWYGECNKKTAIDEEPKTRELDKHSLVTEIEELRNRLCGTVIREDKPNACREHPTMKPVDLIVSMLRNSSTRSDIVLDLCGGSGSTLIACEKPGRHARVMELDPHYCDVIIRRWEKFSGQEAVLEGDGQTFGQIVNG